MSGIATASLLREPARRRHDEDDLQRAVIRFLDQALGQDGLAFAIPNGGKRHRREAARMKGLGVKPGIPDIGVLYRGGRTLFVELKAPRGVVSDAQRDMARRLTYLGYDIVTCKSLECVECALRELGVPLKATLS